MRNYLPDGDMEAAVEHLHKEGYSQITYFIFVNSSLTYIDCE